MKNYIRRWLGLPIVPKAYAVGGMLPHSHPSDPLENHGMSTPRKTFEVVQATNGRIVVFTSHQSNPNGPDKFEKLIYIVPESGDVMDTVALALVAANLK